MPSETKNYRAALIGAGSRGMGLRDEANQADRISVVATADPVETNFESLKTEGVVVYKDFERMLEVESVDIVLVATPVRTHYDVAKRVLEFPITALYLEKPMSTRLWQADELIRKAEEENVYFVVGHQLRYSPGWADVKILVMQGAIGKVEYIRARRGWPLLTHHTHQTDLMRYYADDSPAEWVLGQIHRSGSFLSENIELEMQALGFVQFENGIFGIIEAGQYKQPPVENMVMLIGEKGEIRVGPDAHYRSEDTNGTWTPVPQFEQPDIFEDLLHWIEGGPGHRSAARNGRDTLEILLAIYESSRSRSRISLPMERRGNAFEEMRADGILP
ncbi:MAG: Gfo/Idh/MocA family oxidoreductase [Candidatus Poribacteria bacterium]|nr:Gfo/Idh/MocA family oxidoreductase [Candidatus Poribacteria bacterium]MDE0503995.1 Gfo/Idh/MocA family oxidoreductase [Candidatus Poribacteria bacterium]